MNVKNFGMIYRPSNNQVIARARSAHQSLWGTIPVEKIPSRYPLFANVDDVDGPLIERVVKGDEPLRENYVTRLWREPNGDLHIVDGHIRAAMYHALNKPMPVQIMDGPFLDSLQGVR